MDTIFSKFIFVVMVYFFVLITAFPRIKRGAPGQPVTQICIEKEVNLEHAVIPGTNLETGRFYRIKPLNSRYSEWSLGSDWNYNYKDVVLSLDSISELEAISPHEAAIFDLELHWAFLQSPVDLDWYILVNCLCTEEKVGLRKFNDTEVYARINFEAGHSVEAALIRPVSVDGKWETSEYQLHAKGHGILYLSEDNADDYEEDYLFPYIKVAPETQLSGNESMSIFTIQ